MPETSETDAEAEYVKKLQLGTRKQMRRARAPRKFWPYAMRVYSFHSNRRKVVKKTGKTAYKFIWKEPSKRELMPFGREVR